MDAYQRVIGSIAAKSLMLTSNLKHKVAVPVICIAPMVHYTNKVTKNGYEGSSYIRSTGSLKDFKLASLVSSYVMLRLLEQINASVLIQYTAKFCHFPDELFARHSNNAIAYFKNISRQQFS